MPYNWITDTMPPGAGVYDVTLHLTSRRGAHARCVALAHWPGRRSKRWQLLDMSIPEGVILAWSARKTPFAGTTPRRPMGIICPTELED